MDSPVPFPQNPSHSWKVCPLHLHLVVKHQHRRVLQVVPGLRPGHGSSRCACVQIVRRHSLRRMPIPLRASWNYHLIVRKCWGMLWWSPSKNCFRNGVYTIIGELSPYCFLTTPLLRKKCLLYSVHRPSCWYQHSSSWGCESQGQRSNLFHKALYLEIPIWQDVDQWHNDKKLLKYRTNVQRWGLLAFNTMPSWERINKGVQ